jgi:cob(I)alamin adenosyltransferase
MGKGKTTAAMGLTMRAVGAGLKVYIAQFMKFGEYSEIKTLKKFSDVITVEQFGSGQFIIEKPSKKDIEIVRKGFGIVKAAITSERYDLVILEEASVAVKLGLINEQDILSLISEKPSGVELVITGRHASQKMIQLADLVTEMKEIKHYYKKGVNARPGIEN